MTDTGQSIAAALAALPLTADERAACVALPGIRTLGDLLVALERGDIPKDVATKLRKVLPK